MIKLTKRADAALGNADAAFRSEMQAALADQYDLGKQEALEEAATVVEARTALDTAELAAAIRALKGAKT